MNYIENQNMKNKILIASLLAATASSTFAGVAVTPNVDGYYEITDPITSDSNLLASRDYLLTEIVYVSDGATLNIEAGTTIYGRVGVNATVPNPDFGQPEEPEFIDIVVSEPGTIVITRTGQINAAGTAAQPIIFTFEGDDADGDPRSNPQVPVDVNGDLVTGLWGGIIILGNAPTNNDQFAANSLLLPGTDAIEGIVEPNPADASPDLRGIYGGDRPHDSSGLMRYVSIRNGGFLLGAANEINGLTMGGVGDGTVLEYIEVIAGQDDGFEWFGGTVNSKYLLSAYNNDDAFDYDQGFSGLGQFWAVVMADNGADGDKGGEFDGDDQAGAKPYAVPVIYNMTVIGTGASGVGSGQGGGQIDYDANAAGSLFNSIIVASGIPSLDINGTSADQVNDGNLQIRKNVWHRNIDDINDEVLNDHDQGSAELVLAADNSFANPFLGGANYLVMGETGAALNRYEVGGVYLKPSIFAGNPALEDLEPYIALYFDAVSFKGAFSPNLTPWTDSWTVPSQLGYFVD